MKTYQMSEILCLLTFCIKVYIHSLINIINIIRQPSQNVLAASNLAAYNKMHLPAVKHLRKCTRTGLCFSGLVKKELLGQETA